MRSHYFWLRCLAILTVGLMAVGGFWWLCERAGTVAFLPARAGAEWIDDAGPADSVNHSVYPTGAIFTRTFYLDSRPANARLRLCAFKSARVTINGQGVDGLTNSGKNWKFPATAEVTALLLGGTNVITAYVTNNVGPPALWLSLQAGAGSIGSDASWRASLGNGTWENAQLATDPPVIPEGSPLYDNLRTSSALGRVWPLLVLFGTVALALVAGVNRWLRRQDMAASLPAGGKIDSPDPGLLAEERGNADSRFNVRNVHAREKLIQLLLAVILILRAGLLVNNQWLLPTQNGFDENGHESYIRFIQAKSELPLPNQGWEMYQPPLYYAGSAWLLDAGDWQAGETDGNTVLHVMNGIVGLVHCWLALLCLRLLFPKNYSAQAIGLLVVAFLPPHLYLSQYVTNEPLAGLWVTLALYFTLRVLARETESPWLYIGLGLAAGAALLTKVSTLLAMPVFFLAAGGWLVARRRYAVRDWLRGPGLMLLASGLVCGWYYAWIGLHFGRVIVGNWQGDVGASWWQHPGFHTSADMLGFGKCLQAPLFGSFQGFADGVYSTLWGDGLISGKSEMIYRPPWNYDLMRAGFLLGLAPSFLALAGLVVYVTTFIRRGDWLSLIVLSLVAVYSLGIIYMALTIPSYAQAKAFYGFPALVPFGALIAMGWVWVAQKKGILKTGLGAGMVLWAMVAFATCWVRNNNAETWRARAIVNLYQSHPDAALDNIAEALELKPGDADSHSLKAEALLQEGKVPEGLGEYQEALHIRPNSPALLAKMAEVLAGISEANPNESIQASKVAITMAKRACQLTGYRQANLIGTLATVYASAGQNEAAIAAAQECSEIARQNGQTKMVQANEELIERCRLQLAPH